jgi:outer membrane protein assembly factor BamB
VVLRAPERVVTCRCCGSGTTRAARFCGRCGAGLGPDLGPDLGRNLGPPRGASADQHSQATPSASRDVRGPLVLLATLAALLWWSVTGWDQDVGVRDAEVALPTSVSPEGRGSDAAASRSVPAEATGTATPPCETPAEPVPCIAWWHREDPPAAPPAASRVVGSVVVTATTQGRLVGRDAFTGRQRWERPAGEGARIWPAIGGTIPVSGPRGTDLLSVSTGSPTGTFLGPLEQADSHGAWMLIAAEGRVSARLVTSARGPRPPAWELEVPAGGRAWLTSGGAYLDDGDGEVRALHSNTGRERWRIGFGGRITHVVRTHEGGTAIGIGAPRPRVVTVARSGEVLGDVELPAELDELVVDPTGRVLAGVTEGDEAVLHLLDATTGARRLSVPLGGSGAVTPAVRSGFVAVALRSPTPTLVVLLDGGLIGLRQPLDAEPHQVVLPGGRTVIVVEGSEASAWSLVTGQRRWSVPLGSDARLVDGRALIFESAEGLTALVPDPPR